MPFPCYSLQMAKLLVLRYWNKIKYSFSRTGKERWERAGGGLTTGHELRFITL